MDNFIIIISFLIGIFCGRYYKIVKNDAQILNDIERVNRILNNNAHTDNTKSFNVISPTKQKELKDLKEAFSSENDLL